MIFKVPAFLPNKLWALAGRYDKDAGYAVCDDEVGDPVNILLTPVRNLHSPTGFVSTGTEYDAPQNLRHSCCVPHDRRRFRFGGSANHQPALHTQGYRQRNRGFA